MFLIGITGGSGSGKTTFAKKLLDRVPQKLSVLHMDSYYLPKLPSECFTSSNKENYDHPKAFDWTLLRNHLHQLKRGEMIEAPIYDFKTGMRSQETQTIRPTDVVLFEGIFSLFDQSIRDILDIRVFLHVESDIRFTRRLNRDIRERGRSVDSVIEQYYETVRPMYEKFLSPQKQYADFIIGEESDIAASILTAKVKELLTLDHTDLERAGLNRKEMSFNEESHGVNI